MDAERRDFVYGLREDSRNSAGGDKMTLGGFLLLLDGLFRMVAYSEPSTGPVRCCFLSDNDEPTVMKERINEE